MKKYTPLAKQVIFFGVVGAVTLGIDVTVSTLLYSVFNFPAYLASAIGFLSGFFFNFPMNRKKVFQHQTEDRFSLKYQVAMYIALCVFNLIVTSILVDVMVSTSMLQIQYAKIVVTGLIAVWNFVLFKTIIFSKASKEKSSQPS